MRKMTEADFWLRVKKTPSGCWLWTGWKKVRDYGGFVLDGRTHLAHRLAYELTRGPVPEGLALDHLCSSMACVNPDHLEPVPNGLNTSRGSSNKKHAGGNRFRNVQWRPSCHKWCVQIGVRGRKLYGGIFEHAEVAAMQVNVMSARLFPGFRAFNQVEMG